MHFPSFPAPHQPCLSAVQCTIFLCFWLCLWAVHLSSLEGVLLHWDKVSLSSGFHYQTAKLRDLPRPGVCTTVCGPAKLVHINLALAEYTHNWMISLATVSPVEAHIGYHPPLFMTQRSKSSSRIISSAYNTKIKQTWNLRSWDPSDWLLSRL